MTLLRRFRCLGFAPIAAGSSVFREDGIVEENFQAIEIGAEAIKDDDVWGDEEEIAGEGGIRFVEFVEITPRHEQRDDFSFPSSSGEFENVTWPVLGEHSVGNGAGCIEAEEIKLVAGLADFVQPDGGFHGLALGEVIAEWREGAVGVFEKMLGLEPMGEQGFGGGGCAVVAGSAPVMYFLAKLGYERRQEFFVGVFTQRLIRREPPMVGQEWLVWRWGKSGCRAIDARLTLPCGGSMFS